MYGDKGVNTDSWRRPLNLPHVDQILGQSHGLRVARDGDGPVQVGGGVPVLAVGDPDHGSGELSSIMGLRCEVVGGLVFT